MLSMATFVALARFAFCGAAAKWITVLGVSAFFAVASTAAQAKTWTITHDEGGLVSAYYDKVLRMNARWWGFTQDRRRLHIGLHYVSRGETSLYYKARVISFPQAMGHSKGNESRMGYRHDPVYLNVARMGAHVGRG